MEDNNDSDCEIVFADVSSKESPEMEGNLMCEKTAMLQKRAFKKHKGSLNGNATATKKFIPKAINEPEHQKNTQRRKKGLSENSNASDNLYLPFDETPNPQTAFSTKLQKRLAVSVKELNTLEETPSHTLYHGAKTLVHHSHRVHTFCEIEVESSPNCYSKISKVQVCVGLFYRSWKNFFRLLERTKIFNLDRHFLSIIVSLVKVAIVLVIDSHLNDTVLNILTDNPVDIAAFISFIQRLDQLLLNLLGDYTKKIQKILQDEKSNDAVKNLLDALHIKLAADSFRPVIKVADDDVLENAVASPQLAQSCESQWGFLEFHVLKEKAASVVEEKIPLPSKSNFTVLTSEDFSQLQIAFPHECQQVYPTSKSVAFCLSEVPHRLYLRELMTVDLKPTPKIPQPKKHSSTYSAYISYPSRDFSSCQIRILQHARIEFEVDDKTIIVPPQSWILLTKKKVDQQFPVSSTNLKTQNLQQGVVSEIPRYILIHVSVSLNFSHQYRFTPSLFSPSFQSIIELSHPLKPRKSTYHLFLLRCRRHVYTFKSNALKAGKKVYGKTGLHKMSYILQEFDNIFQLLNVTQLLGDFYFRVCAFQETFWCSSLPFHPLMPGDILGYTWDDDDVLVLKFRDTLEQLLQHLMEGAPEEMFDIIIPSFQRKKLIFFLSECLVRSPYGYSSNIPLHWYVNPVWQFDTVEVRKFPSDEPRDRLRGQYGVFAVKEIKENEIIGPYVGRVYSDVKEISVRGTTPYLTTYIGSREQYEMYIKGGLAIDSCSIGNRMNFVNDYRLVPEMPEGPEIPVFCAARDISPGEEVLVDYGKDYWSPENPATTRPYIYGAQDVRSFLQQTELTWKYIENYMRNVDLAA